MLSCFNIDLESLNKLKNKTVTCHMPFLSPLQRSISLEQYDLISRVAVGKKKNKNHTQKAAFGKSFYYGSLKTCSEPTPH